MSDQKYPRLITSKSKFDEKKKLSCFLCYEKENKQLWRNHRRETNHKIRVKSFADNFHDCPGDDVTCKLCGSIIPKALVIKHARDDHQLVLWCHPADKAKIYFENFIILLANDKSYCQLCNIVYKQSSESLAHVSRILHRQFLSDYLKDKNVDKDKEEDLPPKFYRESASNGIFPFSSTALRCWLCECLIDEYGKLEEHIASEIHQQNLVKIDEITLGNRKLIPTIVTVTENNLKPKEPFPKYFDNFIAKRVDDYYCNLCENNYSSSSLTIEHTEDAVHRNLLIHERRSRGIVTDTSLSSESCKLFVENNIFGSESLFLECYSCKINFPADESAEHINKLSHKAKHSLILAKVDKSDTDVGNDDQKYPDYIRFKYKNDDEKVLTCFICSIKQLWKKHQKDTEHRCRARFFFKNFTDIPGDVVCMLCKKKIPKASVIDHAGNEHQLMPWYRPTDEFVSYFKNFILPMGYKYYCYLCDKVFCRWYLSLEHTEDARHLRLVKDLIKDKDINSQLLSPDFCEQLSANSIYPFNSKQLRCWACQFVIDGYEIANEHIDCDDHTIKLREKKSEILSRSYETSNNWRKKIPDPVDYHESEILSDSEWETDINNFTDQSSISSDDSATVESIPPVTDDIFLKYFENFIGRYSNKIHCYVCHNFFHTEESAIAHMDDVRHRSLTQYTIDKHTIIIDNSCSSETYKLFFDNSIIPYTFKTLICVKCNDPLEFTGAKGHVKGKKHQVVFVFKNNFSNYREKNPCARNQKNTESQSSQEKKLKRKLRLELDKQYYEYFQNYIGKCRKEFFCHVCKTDLPSENNLVVEHLDHPNHRNLLVNMRENAGNVTFKWKKNYERLVRHNVFQYDLKELKCLACNCCVSTMKQVTKHIRTLQHKVNLEELNI